MNQSPRGRRGLRIGLLMEGGTRSGATGIPNYAHHLVAHLVARDDVDHVEVLLSKPLDGEPFLRHPKLGMTLVPFSRNFLLKVALGSFVIDALAIRLDLDVLHDVNQIGPFMRRGRTARVVTIHDLTPLTHPTFHTGYRVATHRLLMRPILRHVDRIVAVSDNTAADVKRLLRPRPGQVVRIHNGLDARFRPRPPDTAALDRLGVRTPYVLYVGTIEPRKNVAGLLDAFERARAAGLAHQLVIVGRPGWKSGGTLARLRRLSADGPIRYLSFLQDSDLDAVYAGADLFVYPSFYEGFGFPPLEAMAAGVPVLCSNTSSLPEVVGDSAMTVDPHDPQAMATALVSLARDDVLRVRLRQSGLKRARSFDWGTTAAAYVALYHELVQRRRG